MKFFWGGFLRSFGTRFENILQSRQTAKMVYNVAMSKLFKLLVTFCFVFFITQMAQAEEYRVLVLPDNIQFDSTNYYIYPESATVFASDTINELKKDGRIETVSMTEVRDALRKNTKLAILTKKALKEFKYNYNVPFVDFKAIARCFNTNKILVLTSQTDVQNFVLRRTLWDILNIPGATVIDPAYKMSTYAVLIDVDKELVIWQNTYYKTISSKESRILAIGFSPATEQLEKIKFYSQYFLSPTIAQIVQTKILPPPLILPSSGIVDVSDKKTPEVVEPLPIDLDYKHKQIVPVRPGSQNNGILINDI